MGEKIYKLRLIMARVRYILKNESAFTFLIDLFLEARAEILQIFQLLAILG